MIQNQGVENYVMTLLLWKPGHFWEVLFRHFFEFRVSRTKMESWCIILLVTSAIYLPVVKCDGFSKFTEVEAKLCSPVRRFRLCSLGDFFPNHSTVYARLSGAPISNSPLFLQSNFDLQRSKIIREHNGISYKSCEGNRLRKPTFSQILQNTTGQVNLFRCLAQVTTDTSYMGASWDPSTGLCSLCGARRVPGRKRRRRRKSI